MTKDVQSYLTNPIFTPILLAIMVKRCGGSVRLLQADIDEVAYTRLIEEGHSDGGIEFTLAERTKQ